MTIYLIREKFDDGMEGPESESYDNVVLSQGGFKTKEEAYAVCKEMAQARFKTFSEWQDMECDNDFKPDDPEIKYFDDNYEARTWYIYDEYDYYVETLEVH